MHSTARFIGSALLIMGATQLWAAEFPVNSYTTSSQGSPAIASDANGNFVVVWQSDGEDGDSLGIFGRRFNAAGVPQGLEFQVNSYTTGYQASPSAAADANGNFVVVWHGGGSQAGSLLDILGQRFDASGVAQGIEFQVNSFTTGYQRYPSVASDASGRFVVVWGMPVGHGIGNFGSGRRFDASGAPLGEDFTIGSGSVPQVASDATGDFIVVWSGGPCCLIVGVFAQRYDSSGTPQGSAFRLDTPSNYSVPGGAAVAADASGNFVVVWSSASPYGSGSEVLARRVSAAGVLQGSEFQVNSYTTGYQARPAVASDAGGNFVVVWQSAGQDGSGAGIFGQRFDATGTPQGREFRVNSYTPNDQTHAAVRLAPSGDAVVAWQSQDQDGSDSGVFAQVYGDLIFRDDFESGDLSRWSTSATGGGDLSASSTAALAGTATGLAALVNDTDALYVQDDSPNDERRYRARFYFDPNGFDTGEADGHQRVRLLTALDPTGLRLLALVLRRVSGQFAIEARARRNDGARDDTAFVDITDAPHLLELDWVRSSAPGASDGSLALWIDEAPVATLSGLDNDSSGVDSVKMGALSVKTGASGSLYFDQFESRRQTYIGP